MKVAAVVPAYNEEDRIAPVLEALSRSASVNEIIVVSDGSTDGTCEEASRHPGVKAFQLPLNLGKGGAMRVGANATDADVLVFLDADLVGLEPEHVDALAAPLLDGSADMSIGIFRGGRRSTDWAQRIAPYITGQRAIRREEFLAVPGLENARFGVEVALGQYARLRAFNVVRVTIPGVTHCLKEEKLGFFVGVAARMKMYWEMMRFLLRWSWESPERLRKRLQVSADDTYL